MRSALLSLPGVVLLAMPLAGEAAASFDQAALHDDLLLTELFRKDVESMGNRRIGRLRDVLINSQGEITTAVVEFDQGIGSGGYAIALLEWSETALEPATGAITVSIGRDGQARDTVDTEGTPGRDIIGRSAVLQDDEEFGTISDVLVDPQTRQPTAVLVEANGSRYALPYPVGDTGQNGEEIPFDMSRRDAEARGEFKRDSK